MGWPNAAAASAEPAAQAAGARTPTAVKVPLAPEAYQAAQQVMKLPGQKQGEPPPGLNDGIEKFLLDTPVEPHAAIRLRSLPWEYHLPVLARGTLQGARYATGALIARIEALTRGFIEFNRESN